MLLVISPQQKLGLLKVLVHKDKSAFYRTYRLWS